MHQVTGVPALPVVALLERDELETAFQPIFTADGETIHGYEALCRLPARFAQQGVGPAELFAAAGTAGLGTELDLRLISLALERFSALGLRGQLFVNVLPQTLLRRDRFARLVSEKLAMRGIRAPDLVIEITEHGLDLDAAQLQARTTPLRELGCQLAIDDLGAGASGLKAWSVLRPDYVKLDRYFVGQIASDPVSAELLRSLLDIAHVMGSRVVAEGVETPDQCAVLQSLGVDCLQGYHLGMPDITPAVPGEPRPKDSTVPNLPRVTHCAESLLIERPPVDPGTRVGDVVAMFQRNPEWHSIAVVTGGRPTGLVRRDELLTLLSKPLYPELYNRKPVERVMETPEVIVEARARLEQVSRLVTATRTARINEDFIIARHGHYAGVGRTIELLQQITRMQVEAATHCNPLTLLPGNREIEAELQRMLTLRVPFVMCHADVDSFKSYNDEYGYRAGDQVLLHLADLLKRATDPTVDFLGHVGGDDFILILRSTDWQYRLQRVFDAFAASVPNCYSPEHREQGRIPGTDREGVPRLFPLMTLSVGAVGSCGKRFNTAAAVQQALKRVKGQAKAIEGHALFLDRDGVAEPLTSAASIPANSPQHTWQGAIR